MDSIRTRRVAELLKHEIAAILANDVDDPRVKNVVLTKVKVTNDLGIARIYFSSYIQKNIKDIEIGLEKSKGFIRKQLTASVHLKKLPQLIFEKDDTPEKASKLDEIFKQIKTEQNEDTE